MHYDAYDPAWGPVTRAPYRQEPYVRATLSDGTMVDGKATAWTETTVLVKWADGHTVHNQWMDSEHVQQIKRSESAWQDPYDDWAYYSEQGEP